MSNFQIVLTGIFIFFIIIGVVVFASLKGNSSQDVPTIVLWGTIKEDLFNKFLTDFNLEQATPLNISYVQKRPDTFHQEFVEALATGKGPDAIILPQDLILKEKDKLIAIPYTSFSQRDFKNTFIQEAELYLTDNGILAIPFALDPLVMYWNRDTLSGAGFARYPSTWDEVTTLSKKVTNKDNAKNISQSGLAFGEFRNVTHAKEIILSLLMQAGNSVIGLSSKSAESTLDFYTQFSNPTKETYSWNRALPQSKNFFISGDLALYFGFASEITDIRTKNPQLNFDVAPMPQSKNAQIKATFGTILGFAFPRSSPNFNTAYSVLSILSGQSALLKWTELTYLPPVRRDMLTVKPADPYLSIFYDSALIAKGWLDPSANDTSMIFQSMVENIVSGKEIISEAITRGSNQINNLITQ
ncbi:MAG: extracellular solute-binding protein [Patescibacteria group bacterium]|nr:extracellular solute-binding protein [Patescibacteria group bacterium]